MTFSRRRVLWNVNSWKIFSSMIHFCHFLFLLKNTQSCNRNKILILLIDDNDDDDFENSKLTWSSSGWLQNKYILSSHHYFQKNQRFQGHNKYDITLWLSSEISPLLRGQFCLAILSLITFGLFPQTHFFLKSLTPPCFIPNTFSPSQEMICFLYHQENYLLGVISTPFNLQTNLFLHPRFSSFASCKRNTYLPFI